jgi:hypothetical protein
MNIRISGLCFTLAVASSSTTWAGGHGIAVDAEQFGPRWQARLQLNSDAPLLTPGLAESLHSALAPVRPRSAALFGDYYLSNPWFGESGGARLTSGLFLGQRGALLGPAAAAQLGSHVTASLGRLPASVPGGADAPGESSLTWPYLGVGYSGGSLRGGWGFSADLGVAAQNPSAIRLGRMNSGASLDEWVREMRLTPLIQLGVSYKF